MKKPPHPGDLIRTEVIEALDRSVSKAAEILRVRRATLSDLLNEKVDFRPTGPNSLWWNSSAQSQRLKAQS